MRDMMRVAADRLRLQAIVATTICLLCASALPVVSYYYVLKNDELGLGPVAWAHWAVAGATCALGVAAQALGNKALLAAHVALGGMLGAALGGFDTAFWYTLDTRCTASQVAFQGCLDCPCAATSTCTAAQLGTEPLCASCEAYPREVCDPALKQANLFVLAFTGLAAVVFLALPACLTLLILCRLEASSAVAAAKRQMVSFAVDQQTCLVEAGEKPSVTPGMLATWVAFLLDTDEPDCRAIGDKCRGALAARGFDLPVPQKTTRQSSKNLGRTASKKGSLSKKHGSGGGGAHDVAATAGGSPAALAAAEAGQAGRGRGRKSQVAPSASDGQTQFVVA